ncbi:hypothetical protein L0Y65_04655 [Candidatus Micrarchaeota archaeon]|nr:hypothetical protein [Candidatus Micrarchaeota archaeon]
MKETEEKLDEEGFEEIPMEPKAEPGSGGPGGSGSNAPGAGGAGANRPDLRVVQTDRDKDGNVIYSNVGGMWKNVSKNGNVFYTLRIGQLKLLVFPNDRK